MAANKLRDDLSNCIITFDSRVLMTQLLDKYKLSHKEVHEIITDFVEDKEKKQKLKYEKYYVVHGQQQELSNEEKINKEIYKIVKETKLNEWLKKLNNAESLLYAVEIAGGSKAPAAIFKPMSVGENVKLKQRAGVKPSNGSGSSTEKPETSKNVNDKKENKTEDKKPKVDNHQTVKNKQEPPAIKKEKKTPVKTETSLTENKKPQQQQQKAANKKGGIGNFFGPATNKKPEESKESKATKSSATMKPPTPKKMEDFFKKQTEKPINPKTESLKATAKANTSVQLFTEEDDEEDENPEEVSSDEEENIEALRRDIISSDVEINSDENEESKPATYKRHRIIDSDDDDDTPPEKQEKLDENVKTEEISDEEEKEPPKSETFLDEDGFVVTIKPKRSSYVRNKKSITSAVTPMKKSPTKKTSPISTKKVSPKSAAAADAKKTKQANIMNFFTKK